MTRAFHSSSGSSLTRPPACPPPVVVLGVSRSGTRLLKEMLSAHSEIAIPPESYFIAALWNRHGDNVQSQGFLADLGRFDRGTNWPPTAEQVTSWLPEKPRFADAIHAVYQCHAHARGKRRYGEKTPGNMQDLEILDRAFPGALYVHIIRDGRDAALSFTGMARRPTFTWRWPLGPADFACQWHADVQRARRFGRSTAAGRYVELRYEDLVDEPEQEIRELCGFLGLSFERAMLEYHRHLDAGLLANHPRLLEPPSRGRRDWRREMHGADVERFEAIAGDLLSDLGYERAVPEPTRSARAGARLVALASHARVRSWRACATLWRRTPAWPLRPV